MRKNMLYKRLLRIAYVSLTFLALSRAEGYTYTNGDYEWYEETQWDSDMRDEHLYGPAHIDLDELAQGFVLEVKKIEIAGYPHAYNPSIVRWKGSFLMNFRFLDPGTRTASKMGLIWLDDEFNPIGEPQLLKMEFYDDSCIMKRQDPRLIVIEDRLYAVYNNVLKGLANREIRRMCMTEIHYDGKDFYSERSEPIFDFEGKKETRSEKNWVPFDYRGNLLFAYSLLPHKILQPILGQNRCETISSTTGNIRWDWGVLRGGTPALLIDGEYIAFFHSTIDMITAHSRGKKVPHYFMGAYTFSAEPPFSITKISHEPIFSRSFYRGAVYRTWRPLHAIFPGGVVYDGHHLWVAYGRQDHEIWIAKIDKKQLLEKLIPVK